LSLQPLQSEHRPPQCRDVRGGFRTGSQFGVWEPIMKAYAGIIAALLLAAAAMAEVDYAAQLVQGDAILKDFKFADGEKLPALKIHYATLGTPRRNQA